MMMSISMSNLFSKKQETVTKCESQPVLQPVRAVLTATSTETPCVDTRTAEVGKIRAFQSIPSLFRRVDSTLRRAHVNAAANLAKNRHSLSTTAIVSSGETEATIITSKVLPKPILLPQLQEMHQNVFTVGCQTTFQAASYGLQNLAWAMQNLKALQAPSVTPFSLTPSDYTASDHSLKNTPRWNGRSFVPRPVFNRAAKKPKTSVNDSESGVVGKVNSSSRMRTAQIQREVMDVKLQNVHTKNMLASIPRYLEQGYNAKTPLHYNIGVGLPQFQPFGPVEEEARLDQEPEEEEVRLDQEPEEVRLDDPAVSEEVVHLDENVGSSEPKFAQEQLEHDDAQYYVAEDSPKIPYLGPFAEFSLGFSPASTGGIVEV